MNVASHTRIALRALRVNKLRSVLTMLGVVIGVAAVITMVAVGAGVRARVAEQIESMGSNLILVWAGSATVSGVRLGAGTQPTVTEDDAWAIRREVPLVEAVAPFSTSQAMIVHGNQNWVTMLVAVTPMFGLRRGPHITRYAMYRQLAQLKRPVLLASARVLSISHSTALCATLGYKGARWSKPSIRRSACLTSRTRTPPSTTW